MSNELRQTWDLESIFPGGSDSAALRSHLDAVEQGLADLRSKLEANPNATDAGYWVGVLDQVQHVAEMVYQGGAFVGCLMSQNTKDRQARVLQGRTTQLFAGLQAAAALFDDRLVHMDDAAFETLLADERIKPLTFNLRERRDMAKRKMNTDRELLAADLSVDGYHGWNSLYDTIVGRMSIKLTVDGKEEELSVGQASNKFYEPDRQLRKELFTKWEEAWSNEAELCSATLNHIAGYRLSLYKHRGWENFLFEPLAINRMTEGTLNAMWEAVSTAKPTLVQFLKRKAKLLGYEAMNWYDLQAPFSTASRKMSYDEAANFVVENFGHFSPQMAEFARHAFDHAWIEAENRSGKAPGAYCTGFPLQKESRIFMTFSGDPNSVRTLAHELGHGYHSHVMRNLPPLSQEYAMNVAETASTFAEMLINAAAIANAQSKEEKLALLDAKITDSLSYLMNIHGRFLFETRFYAERKKGLVSIDRLNELMVAAQKEAYADALGVYHPHFWAAKLHFYATDVPFYNFPYTFGYLFSAGIYARAKAEGPKFEQRYVDLLCDTGRMTVEELASRHLGVDLTKPDFWLTGVKMALDDVDEFLSLTE